MSEQDRWSSWCRSVLPFSVVRKHFSRSRFLLCDRVEAEPPLNHQISSWSTCERTVERFSGLIRPAPNTFSTLDENPRAGSAGAAAGGCFVPERLCGTKNASRTVRFTVTSAEPRVPAAGTTSGSTASPSLLWVPVSSWCPESLSSSRPGSACRRVPPAGSTGSEQLLAGRRGNCRSARGAQRSVWPCWSSRNPVLSRRT